MVLRGGGKIKIKPWGCIPLGEVQRNERMEIILWLAYAYLTYHGCDMYVWRGGGGGSPCVLLDAGMLERDASEEYGTLIRGNHKLIKSYKDDKQMECGFVSMGSSLG